MMKSSRATTAAVGILMAILAVLVFGMPASSASANPDPVANATATPTATATVDSTEPTAPIAAPVTLEAVVASASVAAGGLVIIEGDLADQAGAPISGAGIRVILDGNGSTDSLVMTGDDGAFQTFAEVPAEHAEGDASLVVSFAGNGTHAATQQELALVVEQIPVAERNALDASPPPTDAAGVSPSVDASTMTSENALSTESAETDRPGALSWFYVALVAVGGAALLTTAVLVFRGVYGRSGESGSGRAGSLDMLLEQAAEDEDGEEQADVDVNPEEDLRPRRGPH